MNVLDGAGDAGYAYSVDPENERFKAQEKSSEWECDCSVMLPAQRFEGNTCEEDVDECASGEHNCDVTEETNCDNTEGSFKCTCGEFWQGDAYAPTTDPAAWGCTVESSVVPGHKSKGGCPLAAGYEGCEDIDDCFEVVPLGVDADSDGNEDRVLESKCKNGGTCTQDNLGTGAYICTCVDGWLDDQNCETDRDECEVCDNIPGSWMCLCNNGWTGDGHLQGGCYDADDCEFSPCLHGGTCTDMAICMNIPGSFECECEPGFSGDGYRLCNAVDDCVRWEDDRDIDDATTTDYGEKRFDRAGRVIEEENLVTPAPWADDMPILVYTDCDYDAEAASRGAVRELGLSAIDAMELAQNSVK